MTAPADILDFWFDGDPTTRRAAWFVKNDAFDRECHRFLDARNAAKDGVFDGWAETAEGALALTILLDQLSRNLFRGSAESFAADPKARMVAAAAIDRGFDRSLTPVQRMFLYLPFEHSENLSDQDRSVALFDAVRAGLGDDTFDYAVRHRDVIRRFGRFPHRNIALGRANTPDEDAYLAEPGAGF